MMIRPMELFVLATVLLGLLSSSSAYNFKVGGAKGWGQNPKGSYNSWAERMRFQVNDTLVFKYNKTEDSVLLVNSNDYEACNTSSPIQKLGGDEFKFNRSGPFFFISGVSDRCKHGERLIVVVMSPHHKKPVVTHAPSPSPSPSISGEVEPPAEGPSETPETAPPATSSASWPRVALGVVALVLGSAVLG